MLPWKAHCDNGCGDRDSCKANSYYCDWKGEEEKCGCSVKAGFEAWGAFCDNSCDNESQCNAYSY